MTNKRPVSSPVSHFSPAPALSPVSQCHILVSTRDTDQKFWSLIIKIFNITFERVAVRIYEMFIHIWIPLIFVNLIFYFHPNLIFVFPAQYQSSSNG